MDLRTKVVRRASDILMREEEEEVDLREVEAARRMPVFDLENRRGGGRRGGGGHHGGFPGFHGFHGGFFDIFSNSMSEFVLQNVDNTCSMDDWPECNEVSLEFFVAAGTFNQTYGL